MYKLVNRKFLWVMALGGITTALCGCDKAPQASQSKEITPQTQQATPSQTVFYGYKSFKFGMKPSALLKLAECAPSERSLIKDPSKSKTELEKKKLEGTLTGREDFDLERLTELVSAKDPEAVLLSKFAVPTEYSAFECYLDFAGERISAQFEESSIADAQLIFNSENRLSAIAIPAGMYSTEKLQSLLQGLKEKYSVFSSPSEVDLAEFNQKNSSAVSWLFANGNVELKIIRGYRYTTFKLLYNDQASAKDAINKSQRGKVSSGDL